MYNNPIIIKLMDAYINIETKNIRSITFGKEPNDMPLDQILNIARKNDKIPGDHLELFYNYMYSISSMELQQQGRQKRFTLPEMKNVIKLIYTIDLKISHRILTKI